MTKDEKKLLQTWADKGCEFVLDGQGPECAEEWPNTVSYWCVSCFCRGILTGAVKA